MNNVHFEQGDIVRLKTGGPNMTLVELDNASNGCTCSWWETNENRKRNFPTAELEPVLATNAMSEKPDRPPIVVRPLPKNGAN